MTTLIDDTIVLACAADDFFAIPLGVTIYSALQNLAADKRILLFVLDGGIRARNKQQITRLLDPRRVEIRWIRPSEARLQSILLKMKGNNYPVSSYYRLLLAEIIPDHISKVIYLDTDVIVEGDLNQLWSLDIGDSLLMAAQDAVQRTLAARHLTAIDFEAMGVSRSEKYLNAGVLFFNLNRWRAEQMTEQVLQLLSQNPDFPFPDQDALNIALAGKWRELDPRWNQIHVVHKFKNWQESPYSEAVFSELISNPYIIHYTSRPKPWDKGCEHPRKDSFLRYLNQTEWSSWNQSFGSYWLNFLRRSLRRANLVKRRLIFSHQGTA